MDRGQTSSIAETKPSPTVSIVVRTYPGRQGFLQEALASLQRQTYSPLEVVVVEDGGQSAQATVAAIAAQSGHRFTYHSAAKVGRCVAGNLGLERATGEFLGFLDDDDQFLPDHVAALSETLTQRPSAVAAYAQAWEVPTLVHAASPLAYTERSRYLVSRPPFSQAALAARNLFPIQAVLFRRSLFETYGGLDDKLDNLEDWDLWRRYAAAGDFVAVDRITSLYRVPGTMRSALERQRKLDAYRPLCAQSQTGGSPAVPLRQRWQRRFDAAVRQIAIQPPLFALRWHFRNWKASRSANQKLSVDDRD